MYNRFKLARHQHSGRLRPHEYTSYLPLGILLVVVGLVLTVCTVSAAPHPDPQSGSIGLDGTMPGKPPAVAATISSPLNGQHFTTSPVAIKGTCPVNTLVEIFKNDIFAGSSACNDKSTFSLDIDLLIGQNRIVARVYDSLNQAGPDSDAITIFYDALPPQADSLAALSFGGPQMLLVTDAVFRGSFPKQQINLPVTIIGGAPPYAVNAQWGDSNNKIVPRNDNQTFTLSHPYDKAGTYQISLQGSDAQGRVSFLTVAAIVNGQPASTAAASGAAKNNLNKLLVLWPLYVVSVAIVISFWLGEKREKKVLGNFGQSTAFHSK